MKTPRTSGAARIIDTGLCIRPFGERVGDLPLLGRTLAEHRNDEIDRARIAAARWTFADYAFASAPILAAFARQARGPSRLALPARSPSRLLAPVSSIAATEHELLYDIFFDAPPGAGLADLRTLAQPVLVDLPWQTVRRELPRVGRPPHHIDLPSDGIVAAHLEHWVHLLWLAPLLLPMVLGRKRNQIGKGVRIHPSAHVEGSVIADGARIGAQCSVRMSYVGPGSNLSDFTKVTRSVLGESTHTLADASFSHVVALGRGTLASLLLRDTLLGRRVFLTSGVIFWNESIDGTILVDRDGEDIDTGRKCLGGCAGHGCILGARTIVAPGRALPNATTVVMRREEGVLSIPEVAPGTPMCWHDGALVPVQRLLVGDAVPDELMALPPGISRCES